MGKVIRPFCWHQNFVPWGLSVPALGLYTCIKSWKKCIKSDFKDIFLKLATNEWSDKTFLLTSKLCPLGVVCPCPGAIYMYNSWIFFYKIRLQRDFFETFNKWPKWQDVPVDIKISSPRGCQPLPWGYIHVKSWKNCIKSDFKEICFLNMCVRSEVEEILFKLEQMTAVMSPFCWPLNFGFNGLSASTLGLCSFPQ